MDGARLYSSSKRAHMYKHLQFVFCGTLDAMFMCVCECVCAEGGGGEGIVVILMVGCVHSSSMCVYVCRSVVQ